MTSVTSRSVLFSLWRAPADDATTRIQGQKCLPEAKRFCRRHFEGQYSTLEAINARQTSSQLFSASSPR
jgi:hypothetical protein